MTLHTNTRNLILKAVKSTAHDFIPVFEEY